jgi:hypothetical protein
LLLFYWKASLSLVFDLEGGIGSRTLFTAAIVCASPISPPPPENPPPGGLKRGPFIIATVVRLLIDGKKC